MILPSQDSNQLRCDQIGQLLKYTSLGYPALPGMIQNKY